MFARSFYESNVRIFEMQYDRKIKFRMVSVQHFINEAPGLGNISVVLLSMEGQRALRFHQKYLNLCSEDEQRSYRFETT